MPHKLWTSATVSAADLNDYIQEQVIATVTSVARPSSPVEGQHIVETDTNKKQVYDGSAWWLDGGLGWTSFTPSWSNFTIGNGTQTGYYRYSAGGMWVFVDVTLGSTSSVSGTVTMTLPNSETLYTTVIGLRSPLGLAELYDDSATTGYEGVVRYNSSTSIVVLARDASATYAKSAVLSSTVPFTWTTSDLIQLTFFVPLQ